MAVMPSRVGSGFGSLNTLLALLKQFLIVLIAFQTPSDVSKSRIPVRSWCRPARLRRKFSELAAATLCLRFSISFEFVPKTFKRHPRSQSPETLFGCCAIHTVKCV